ncbi:hypothetical protein [Cellulomonas sp. ES6]|uniref:hypothetical protein n=1 Tax=Cellulomonas sp. ES6 TaxID=3039384 RepID=UPI0024B74588|nr:hypothetical protein [Cellulomonas sp. ES6]WHP18158.1 hypothetical protein P9841_03030 [Cellulomonas sp. ES6]
MTGTTGTTRLALALAAAGAYSAFPSAWYHLVQEQTGSRWTAAVLFAAHGVAQVAAMTVVARPRTAARASGAATGRVVAALLLLDTAGALLLVAAPAPGGFALLLAGRVVTGLALGALTPLATAGLARHPRGTAVATAAVLGAVGAGALLAGGLAAAGWTRPAVLGVGLVLLPAAAVLVRRVEVAGVVGAVGASSPVAVSSAVRVQAATLPALLAFACTGVLGLFSSTLPGVVAALAGGAATVAGATTGLVMLSAGGARLLLGGLPARRVHALALAAAVAGAAGEAVALHAGHLAGALASAALLGAAAGVGFDAALRAAAPRGLTALARTQRGGQLGLVLPVLAYPVVVA